MRDLAIAERRAAADAAKKEPLNCCFGFVVPTGEPYPGPDLRERSIRRVGMCVDRYDILSTSALAFSAASGSATPRCA